MWGLIIVVLCAFPSIVYSTGSSSSNTIQPTSDTSSEVEDVKPLPFSSVVLFERCGEQLCVGVLITQFNALVSFRCHQILLQNDEEVGVFLGITYGRFHDSAFAGYTAVAPSGTAFPFTVVRIHRCGRYPRMKYESIVFIPEEIDNDLYIEQLLGVGVYNKETRRTEQFGLIPKRASRSFLYAKSMMGRIPEHMLWQGGLVFFLDRYVGMLAADFGERDQEFIYVVKIAHNRDDFLRRYHILTTFDENIHDPLVSM